MQGADSRAMDEAEIETWITETREQTAEHAERRRAKAKAAAASIAQAAQDDLLEEQGVWDTSGNGEMVRSSLLVEIFTV